MRHALPIEMIKPGTIREIPTPQGYTRLDESTHSFTEWLRNVKLKTDNHVYLYNGRLKNDQTVQYAVMDISVGNSDLQQCADAVIRLRAEYLAVRSPDEISFVATSGQPLSFANWRRGERYRLAGNRLVAVQESGKPSSVATNLPGYLQTVFSYCGTYSLQKELVRINNLNDILPGDVFIHGGFPGHAMIVADVAINVNGEKCFLLAQSYMPAQDIHIVTNPAKNDDDPWYEADDVINAGKLVTPEWQFKPEELATWKSGAGITETVRVIGIE